MAEYIDREAALELLKLIECKESSINFAGTMIRELRDMPAADVRPVVRGEWIEERMRHLLDGKIRPVRVCSVCNAGFFQYDLTDNVVDFTPNFCPNCGADMRKEYEP